MLLQFPDRNTLLLAITSGTVPADIVAQSADVAVDPDGCLWVSFQQKCETKTLKSWGVTVRRSPGKLKGQFEQRDSWLQILPLIRNSQLIQTNDRTPVLFCLKDERILPDLVNEILRQRNDRQSFRRVTFGKQDCVLLRVIGAPYYSLLRASEQWAGDGLKAFVEQSARVWIEAGFQHPLVEKISPAEGQHLLISEESSWQALEEKPFQDIYQAVDFQLPSNPESSQEQPQTTRMKVPVCLTRSSSSEAAEIFVLSKNAIPQLEQFVQSSSDSVLQRLAFAVAETDDSEQPIVVLRIRPGRTAPPVLVFDGLACRNYLKIPNLFIPVDRKLHPPLRRDAVRELLASNSSQLVWLSPVESEDPAAVTQPFRTLSLPDAAFLPLTNWVDYVLDRDREVLTTWRQSHQFEFDDFICKSAKQKKEKKEEPKRQAVTRSQSSTSKPTDEEETPGKKRVRKLIQEFRRSGVTPVEDEHVTRLKQELSGLENTFRDLESPLEDPERLPMWDQMADLNTQLGRFGDASICRQHQFWDVADVDPEYLRLWFLTEARSAEQQGTPVLLNDEDTVSARELRRILKNNSPSPGDSAQLAAWIPSAVHHEAEAALLKAELPAIQKYLETHERSLSIRTCWIAWRTIAGANDDVLTLARARDRILERMYGQGLMADRDLPSFLRLGNHQSGDRFRRVREHGRQLYDVVHAWSEENRGLASATTQHYIDLIFAFAYARMGETSEATKLLSKTKQSLLKKYDVVHHWLFEAYQFRTQQVINGQPLGDPFPDELIEQLDSIGKLDLYKIDRLRQHSGILEPVEKLDPYRDWRRRDEKSLEKQLADLFVEKNRDKLKQRLITLLNAEQSIDDQAKTLATALELSTRLGEDFAEQLQQRIGKIDSKLKDPIRRAEVLEKGLQIAAHYDHATTAQDCFTRMTKLLESQKNADVEVLEALGRLLSRSFQTLRKMGKRDEIAFLLELMTKVVRDSRAQKKGETERLRILLQLAGGWFYFGQDRGWEDIDIARKLLLSKALIDEGHVGAKKQTDLAVVYIEAVGQAPLHDAIDRLMDLFQNLSGIRDGQTVNSHYSLKQLDIVEALVQTIVSDSFVMDRNSQRWMDDEEFLIRRRIHQDMKQMVEQHS